MRKWKKFWIVKFSLSRARNTGNGTLPTVSFLFVFLFLFFCFVFGSGESERDKKESKYGFLLFFFIFLVTIQGLGFHSEWFVTWVCYCWTFWITGFLFGQPWNHCKFQLMLYFLLDWRSLLFGNVLFYETRFSLDAKD